MQTREMAELAKSDEGIAVLRGMLSVKSKGLPERKAAIDEKKATIRKYQDEINSENRLVTRDTGAVIRLESVLVGAGVLAKEDCQFFGKETDSEGDPVVPEGETPEAE